MSEQDNLRQEPEKLMPLARALYILSRVHTQDDDLVGFVVRMGAVPEWGVTQGDYIQAWRSVRHAIGESYDPREIDAALSHQEKGE